MVIIGITGTIGAGKGTIVEYLVSSKGFQHFSVREYLIDLLVQQGIYPDRDAMVKLANELRQKFGNAYIVQQLFEKAQEKQCSAVIESIRHPDEVNFLKSHAVSFYLLAVDADIYIRYQRILMRQSSTDQLTFEEFQEKDRRELYGEHGASQNISACMQLADAHLRNDGTFEELYAQIDAVFKTFNIQI